ncbi:hypothetical protein BJ912DRAFT_988912 [Pholiota molesta]|nr:hypothetical protein BJ912DRAFT_988912 [Pholiota molesta]
MRRTRWSALCGMYVLRTADGWICGTRRARFEPLRCATRRRRVGGLTRLGGTSPCRPWRGMTRECPRLSSRFLRSSRNGLGKGCGVNEILEFIGRCSSNDSFYLYWVPK